MTIARRTILALLVVAAVAPVVGTPQLPKGEALLDKYIEVTGGKAAYEKIHSTIATGTMEMSAAMGLKGKLTIYQAEPARMMTEITIEGIGTIQEGSDGTVAWTLSAMQGARL
jgi:hypothetical protein